MRDWQGLREGVANGVDDLISIPKSAPLRRRALALRRPLVKSELLRPLQTAEALSRCRYKGDYLCPNVIPDIGLGFGLYVDSLKRANIDVVKRWNLIHLPEHPELVKLVADCAFKGGYAFDKHWRFLAHIDKICDYKPVVSMEELVKELDFWNEPKLHTWNGDEELFYEKFELAVDKVLDYRDKVLDTTNVIPIEEWVLNRTNWAKTGSAVSAEKYTPVVTFDDVDYKAAKTKWSAAWFMDDERLLDMLKFHRGYSKVIMKRETGKVRLVIGSNLELYLKMHYLSEMFIDQFFSGDERSTLWMNGDETMRFWEKVSVFKGFAMPIDQGKFDQMQTRRMVLRLVMKLRDKLFKMGMGEHGVNVFNLVLQELSQSIIFDGRSQRPWLNGVLSGLKWTALLDTLLNLITIEMAKMYCAEKGINVNPLMFCAQGDDDLLRFGTFVECIGVYWAITSFGFNINPRKFFISRSRDEFLRRVIGPGLVTGYPARSVVALLWSNPVKSEVEPTTATSLRNTWKLFADRLGCRLLQLPVKKDIALGMRWSSTAVDKWWNVPAGCGGGGVPPYGFTTLEFIPKKVPAVDYTFKSPGVDAMVSQFGARDEWTAYARKTLNIYTEGRPVGKLFYGDVPVKYQTGINSAKYFVGDKYKVIARQFRRQWFPDWTAVKTHIRSKFNSFRKESKEFEPVLFTWRKERIDGIGGGERQLEPIPPATMRTLSVARTTARQFSKNYDDVLARWAHASKAIQITALFEGFSASAPCLDGYSVGMLSYLAGKKLAGMVATLKNKKTPNVGAWKQILVNGEVSIVDDLFYRPMSFILKE